DYVDPQARLINTTIYNWIHPIGEIVTSLITWGMTLDWLHEHDAVAWRMFRILVEDASGLYRWPDKPWLPLPFPLSAPRPYGAGHYSVRKRTVPSAPAPRDWNHGRRAGSSRHRGSR